MDGAGELVGSGGLKPPYPPFRTTLPLSHALVIEIEMNQDADALTRN